MKRTEYISALAEDLLKDVEHSTSNVEGLVLKASRLARFLDDAERYEWLQMEMVGYNLSNHYASKYLTLTGRWIDFNSKSAWFGNIAMQESLVLSYERTADTIKAFVPSGTYSLMQMQDQLRRLGETHTNIMKFRGICSRVRGLIQTFATEVIYEMQFSQQAETVFQQYQQQVDSILASKAQKASELMPHAFNRLQANDPEAVRHALTTCRKAVDNMADALFPARNTPSLIGNEKIEVTQRHVLNRIRAYLHDSIGKNSRYERISRGIRNLHDRHSTGVHAGVSIEEAKALLLQTYLYLGEIATISKKSVEFGSAENNDSGT